MKIEMKTLVNKIKGVRAFVLNFNFNFKRRLGTGLLVLMASLSLNIFAFAENGSLALAQTTPAPATTTGTTQTTSAGSYYLISFEVVVRGGSGAEQVGDNTPGSLKTYLEKNSLNWRLELRYDNKPISGKALKPVNPVSVSSATTTAATVSTGKDYALYRMLSRLESTQRGGQLVLLDNKDDTLLASQQLNWNFEPGQYQFSGAFVFQAETGRLDKNSAQLKAGLPRWATELASQYYASGSTSTSASTSASAITADTSTTGTAATTRRNASGGNGVLLIFLTALFMGLGLLILVHAFQVGLFGSRSRTRLTPALALASQSPSAFTGPTSPALAPVVEPSAPAEAEAEAEQEQAETQETETAQKAKGLFGSKSGRKDKAKKLKKGKAQVEEVGSVEVKEELPQVLTLRSGVEAVALPNFEASYPSQSWGQAQRQEVGRTSPTTFEVAVALLSDATSALPEEAWGSGEEDDEDGPAGREGGSVGPSLVETETSGEAAQFPILSKEEGEVETQIGQAQPWQPPARAGQTNFVGRKKDLGSGFERKALDFLLAAPASKLLHADRVEIDTQVFLSDLAKGGLWTKTPTLGFSAVESRFMENESRLDFLLEIYREGYPTKLLAIETDGFQHYSDQVQRERDVKKNRILAKMGIPLVRVYQVHQLEDKLKELVAVLWEDQAAPAHPQVAIKLPGLARPFVRGLRNRKRRRENKIRA